MVGRDVSGMVVLFGFENGDTLKDASHPGKIIGC